jgi:hypothetical protein
VKKLTIYIAASWKHRHAVEMLTDLLRHRGHEVRSFVENNHGEDVKPVPFETWVESPEAEQSFKYDTRSALDSQITIYIGPSGKDAAAEAAMAWAAGRIVLGLYAKGEDFGLMRKMIEWYRDYRSLLRTVDAFAGVTGEIRAAQRPSRG